MIHTTKKDAVYQIIRKEILSGTLKANEKIVISDLSKRFSVSEIPVREALSMLKTEGLIDFAPHVGARVSSLSKKDIQEIFEIRIELEGLATRLAANIITDKDLDELQKNIDLSINSFESKDYDQFEKLNYQFHKLIYEKSQNERLNKMIDELWKNSNRYPSIFSQNDDHILQSIKDHKEILKALEKNDGVLAEKIVLQHKAKAVNEILRIQETKYYSSL